MNRVSVLSLTALSGLAVGIAIGVLLTAGNVQPEAAVAPVAPVSDAGSGDQASVDALKARIRSLEARLARAERGEKQSVTAGSEIGKAAVVADEKRSPQNEAAGMDRGHGEFFERMRRLKEDDPERFAEISRRIKEGRTRMKLRSAAAREFLSSIDTDGMSEEQKRVHEEYQQLLVQEEKLRDQVWPQVQDIDNPPKLPSEEKRNELMESFRELQHRKHELERAERETLLSQTAEAVGFSGDEARILIDTIRSVYEATGERRFHGHMPPSGSQPGK